MTTIKKYPFKFLDSYTREDSDIFFGRTEEVDKIYEMVFQSDLLLIYGASGTGKSSLIQCGLASRFQSHDWLALNIRRGSDLNASFERALQDAGGNSKIEDDDLDWLDDDLTSDVATSSPAVKLSPLAKSLKAIYLKHFKPIYLIFDQFEELYVLGNKDEQDAFITTVKQVLKVEQPVKVILSIREEYLGYLYEFERKVPELLRKKLRVEPMILDKVKDVINGVNAFEKGNVHLKKGEENAIAETIFEKIKGEEKTLHIQLPYLQVFLDKLYMEITGDESRKAEAIITMAALNKMGDIGDVLRNFLDEQVLKTARDLHQKPTTIWKILSPFVTLDGTKEPINEIALGDRLPQIEKGLIQKTLQAFVKARILRYTENEQLYEIAHDSLAKQIHAKRSDEEIAILEVQRLIKSQIALNEEAREYFTEKQLLFIAPFLDKFKLNGEEQNWIDRSEVHLKNLLEVQEATKMHKLASARKRARVLMGMLGFAFVALLAAGYFWYDAKGQKDLAIEATEKAEKEKDKAEKALADFKEAEVAKKVAEKQNKRNDFEDLLRRVNTIIDADLCPDSLIEEMKLLVKEYPDWHIPILDKKFQTCN